MYCLWRGARLVEIRRDRNLSQYKLASLTGFDRSLIRAWEYDRVTPSLTSLARLADALEVSPVELLDLGARS